MEVRGQRAWGPDVGVGAVESLWIGVMAVNIDIAYSAITGGEVAIWTGVIADERNDDASLSILVLDGLHVLVVWKFHTRDSLGVFILGLQEDDRAAIRDLRLCDDLANRLHVSVDQNISR